MQGHTATSGNGHFLFCFRGGRMLQCLSGAGQEMSVLHGDTLKGVATGQSFLETGDRASEVSQNFGMNSREQNFEESSTHVQHFTRGWDLERPPTHKRKTIHTRKTTHTHTNTRDHKKRQKAPLPPLSSSRLLPSPSPLPQRKEEGDRGKTRKNEHTKTEQREERRSNHFHRSSAYISLHLL